MGVFLQNALFLGCDEIFACAAWKFLEYTTYERPYGNYEKSTDAYVFRVRAALTRFTKRHRNLERM